MNNYGTVAAANIFFESRLHAYDWEVALHADKQKALNQATELIDQFDYIGQKYTVQAVIDSLGECVDLTTEANQELLRQAELDQPLQFPRGGVNTVPTEIENACYLIAKALLSGRDPEADLEAIAVKSAGYGGVRTSYDRSGNTQEHLAHLIPSPQAWNLIRPFLRERNTFDIKRVS